MLPLPNLFLLTDICFPFLGLLLLILPQLPLKGWHFPFSRLVLLSLALCIGLASVCWVLLPPLLNLICVFRSFRLAMSQDPWWQENEKKKKIREATEGTDCRNSCLFLSWVQHGPLIKQGQPPEVLLVINWTRLCYLDASTGTLKLAFRL